ncbi:MAG: pyridoxamine 5'-phosphate oxidase family protein [Gammaproteobacteria bacterium]|nr:pyridoxamine 5'-phosphate oxidase family protein [Gammaproteobacteria bacterium]MDE0258223.1 pyridoxamine 5'-phosphate oxidase family protein [Gammaproteobacteria bacterium]
MAPLVAAWMAPQAVAAWMTPLVAAWMASLAVAGSAGAQTPSRAELLGVAREVVEGAAFVSLATLDEEGFPAVRAMDPLPPNENWVVWLATNPGSRKVEQLRANPRVALHYLAEGVPAYVTVIGRARLVDDPEMKARHWKESWTPFYPDRDESVLLIEVTPIRLEVVSEAHGAPGDPETWRAHVVEFGSRGGSRRAGRAPARQLARQLLADGIHLPPVDRSDDGEQNTGDRWRPVDAASAARRISGSRSPRAPQLSTASRAAASISHGISESR